MKCPVGNCDGNKPGYMRALSWAKAHHAKSIFQKRCRKCLLWYFPCEEPHKCKAKEPAP